MAATLVHAVDVLSVEEMRAADCFGQGSVIAGDGDYVDVVGHQAIAQNVQTESLRLLLKQFEVNRAVVVKKENVLLVITTLRDVVRNILQNYSG